MLRDIVNKVKQEIIKEAGTTVTSGLYNGPMEIGLKKWKKEHLGPFQEFANTEFNHKKKQKTLKNNIKKVVGVWEKNSDGSYDTPEHEVHTVNEWVEITSLKENSLRNFIKSVLRKSF
jgi:hypothetical protein